MMRAKQAINLIVFVVVENFLFFLIFVVVLPRLYHRASVYAVFFSFFLSL
jgi:hypothetical protein